MSQEPNSFMNKTSTASYQRNESSGSSKSPFDSSVIKESSQTVQKIQDQEKNDLISIEDEIYNMAFRPSKA